MLYKKIPTVSITKTFMLYCVLQKSLSRIYNLILLMTCFLELQQLKPLQNHRWIGMMTKFLMNCSQQFHKAKLQVIYTVHSKTMREWML
ncbi:Uncharacterised protein [Mycobacteroides abscessus subsp. abscessus]|nr:Uncharacterised protein [Mycobacteroides abscessus subsp. abscessus]